MDRPIINSAVKVYVEAGGIRFVPEEGDDLLVPEMGIRGAPAKRLAAAAVEAKLIDDFDLAVEYLNELPEDFLGRLFFP
jgi:hypothetical protein